MNARMINFGIDLASTGPRVVADVEGSTTDLDLNLLQNNRDGWIVPILPAEGSEALLPDFRSLKSLLGRTEGLNFGGRAIRKPHFVVKEMFELLGRVAENGYGGQVGEVVVSVSAFYQEQQRHYLLQCAENAGIGSMHLVDDSTATALSHIHELDDGWLLVINVGFERCEMALADLCAKQLTTKAYEQTISAGGLALTSLLMKSIIFSLDQQKSRSITENFTPVEWLAFFQMVEGGKQNLTMLKAYDFILARDMTGFDDDLAVRYDNADFRSVAHLAYEDLCESIARLNSRTGIDDGEIRQVLIGGKGSRIPLFQDLLRLRYGDRLMVADEKSEVYGCIEWARVVATPSVHAGAPANLAVPDIRPDEEAMGTLIRGSVEIVGEDPKSRRHLVAVTGMSNESIHALVRRKATSLYKSSRVAICKELLSGLEQVVREFRPLLEQAPAAAHPEAAEAKAGTLPASYRGRVRKISESIKKTFELANATDAAQQEGVLLERAIQFSHEIELFARQYADQPRLEAVVNVHTKCAEMMMGRSDWTGSDDTTFILAEKWLLCALRTVSENGLSSLRSQLADHVATLYHSRIRYLISINLGKEARALRNKFRTSFSEAEDGIAKLDQCLAGMTDPAPHRA